jgi:SAM-dependent methyltransferase
MINPKPHEDPALPREARIAAVGYDYASQEKQPIAACHLCGSDRWTVLTHQDRYGYPAQATACNRCGLTILNPRMAPAAYARFYDGIYRPLVSAYHGRRIDARTVQEEQWVYASHIERLLAPFLEGKAGASFLDVGGSTGVVAAHFARRFGVQATVLDPAPAEIAEAQALGVETITSLVEEWQPEGRRFQVIGMFQTIDHLLDVAATLAKLRTLIVDEGIFVVDILDFRAVYLKNWSIEAAIKIDHPFSLMEGTAEAFLRRAGFEAIRKWYHPDRQHVAYVCRPSAPDAHALPSSEWVDRFFWEVRYVQNAARVQGDPP